MTGWLYFVGGVLLVALGTLWTLQGLDIVGGSGMSGEPLWAVIGPIVGLVGLWLLVRGVRQLRTARGSQ